MAAVQRKLVHKQFNSPMGLYSQQNVKDTLTRELQAFGDDGIEVDEQIAKPLNLANSEVLRAVEEEEEMKCGYKRVAWPPVSEERIIREFTPQPAGQFSPPQQYSPTQASAVPTSAAGPPTAAVAAIAPGSATAPATHQPQSYRASSYDHNQPPTSQQPFQEQQQQQYQPQYNHSPPSQQYHNQQQPQSAAQPQQPQYQGQAYQQQQQQQQPSWAHNQQQQQQPPSWAHQQQQHQQPQVAAHLQPQVVAPLQPQQQQQPNQYQTQQQPLYQFEPQQNQFDSYSQPQQLQPQQQQQQHEQQHQPYPQDYRGVSPGMITLLKEAPVSQKPAPVYTSQPAAVSFQGGSKLRGDLKWPPPEYKEAAAKENEERLKLAAGPVCRPRRPNRDYTPFFAKNAINCYYPSYKVPPGTQHMYA